MCGVTIPCGAVGVCGLVLWLLKRNWVGVVGEFRRTGGGGRGKGDRLFVPVYTPVGCRGADTEEFFRTEAKKEGIRDDGGVRSGSVCLRGKEGLDWAIDISKDRLSTSVISDSDL